MLFNETCITCEGWSNKTVPHPACEEVISDLSPYTVYTVSMIATSIHQLTGIVSDSVNYMTSESGMYNVVD